MIDPVYILIRTSRRPEFFRRAMDSVRRQTYKKIITIVHSDDPRDEYVTGDIIIRGHAYGPDSGNAPYNLYNNRLLDLIPEGEGWYCFLDDDDEYASDDVIERLVNNSKRDYINVGHVIRWNEKVFPEKWGQDKSFQTECFFLHTDHKRAAKWWPHLGGDHYYSKQLTKILPVNWLGDITICKAQTGKGRGKRLDYDGQFISHSKTYKGTDKISCLGISPHKVGEKQYHVSQGKFINLPYDMAIELEKLGKVKITYTDITVTRTN